MKPRKWIIVAFLILLVLVCGLYVTKKTLSENRNLEQQLIHYISPAVGGTVEVEKVDIGFFSVYLKGIKLSIPLQSFALKVEDIKIGLSFFKLVASRGDIAGSINKIIFIDPIIEAALPAADSSQAPTGRGQANFSIGQFPVNNFLVKNGAVLLTDGRHKKIILGEQLTGEMVKINGDLSFELAGKFAARRRNLFLSGVLSENIARQHVSVRLAKARIHKDIQWRNVTVRKGKLDGLCEISFTGKTFPENIDANGIITIEDGIGTVDEINGDIKDITLSMQLTGNRFEVDSITADWQGMNVFGKGSAGFSTDQNSTFYLRIEELKNGLAPHVPEVIRTAVTGKNWLEFYGRKKEGQEQYTVNVIGGGFLINDKPVSRIVGQCSFIKGSMTLDTAYFEYDDLSLGLTGLFDFNTSPLVYTVSLGFTGNAGTISKDLTGAVTVRGDVHGVGAKPHVNLLIAGDSIAYRRVSLGSPRLSLSNRGNTIVLKSRHSGAAAFSLSGTIDSIHREHPGINLETEFHKEALGNLFEGLPGNVAASFDSLRFRGTITGKLPNPEMTGSLSCRSDKITGSCTLSLLRENDTDRLNWRLAANELRVCDSLFHGSASGYVAGDTLGIHQLSILDTLRAAGFLTMKENGIVHIEASSDRVSLHKLNVLLFDGNPVFEEGHLNGKCRVSGPLSAPKIHARANVRACSISGIASLETDVVLNGRGKEFSIMPFVIRKNKKILISMDTLSKREHLRFSGTFDDVDLGRLLKKGIEEDYTLSGLVSGQFSTSRDGLPVRVSMRSQRIVFNAWKLDSAAAAMKITKKAVVLDEIVASDSSRCRFVASGEVPWPFFSNSEGENDTLRASLNVKGDILASLEKNYMSPVGGSGVGEIDLSFYVTNDEWHFLKAYGTIPHGKLTVTPFVPDGADDIRINVSMDDSAKLNFNFYGKVNRRPISIFISHMIPKGYKPIMLGNINCGIINVKTVKNGIHIFLPGFMEHGAVGEFEFAPREPFDAFAISGPIDRLKITGTWVVRNGEFTFPFLEDEAPPMEEDPFPYIDWELDIKVGNRNIAYFYNVGKKMRRFYRFTELYVDPASADVKIRGRDIDKTFRIYGKLRSYKGYAFYGRNFDRNIKVGVDFLPEKLPDGRGYENMPVIWGSAEAFSDSSRFDRIKLTLLTRDSLTGVLRERGRFKDIAFRVSSDFEEIPGETENEFYREAGLRFVTLKGAGEFVSDFGDQYFKQYLLQRVERKLARRLGLDVISFETSIASNYFNYFYNNQNHYEDFGEQWDYLAFANVGVTLGRYFLRDRFFLKWRTELIPRDMILNPEHNIGLEVQPMEYLWLDFNYGFYKAQELYKSNPKLRMQLRLPIGKFRDFLNF